MNKFKTILATLAGLGAVDVGILRQFQRAHDEDILIVGPEDGPEAWKAMTSTLDDSYQLQAPRADLFASHSNARLAAPQPCVWSDGEAVKSALDEAIRKRLRKNAKRARDWARSDAGYYFVQA